MKTYDEIVENVIEATAAHRKRIRRMQAITATSVMCAACVFGLSVYLHLEPPQTLPEFPDETQTTTILPSAGNQQETTGPHSGQQTTVATATGTVDPSVQASTTAETNQQHTDPTSVTGGGITTDPVETQPPETDPPEENSSSVMGEPTEPTDEPSVSPVPPESEETPILPPLLTPTEAPTEKPTQVQTERPTTSPVPIASSQIPSTECPTDDTPVQDPWPPTGDDPEEPSGGIPAPPTETPPPEEPLWTTTVATTVNTTDTTTTTTTTTTAATTMATVWYYKSSIDSAVQTDPLTTTR